MIKVQTTQAHSNCKNLKDRFENFTCFSTILLACKVEHLFMNTVCIFEVVVLISGFVRDVH